MWYESMRRNVLRVTSLLLVLTSSTQALSVDEARHLLERTGFGAPPHEIATLLPMNRQQAVEYIVSGLDAGTALAPSPAFVRHQSTQDYLDRIGDYPPAELLPAGMKAPEHSPEQQTHLTKVGMEEMVQLRVWWLDQMVSTRTPQAERLALFWHNHFTSKYFDVLVPTMMYQQVQSIRQFGGQNFPTLLKAMMEDPAMLVFLDNSISGPPHPNENFARELLELFSLGVGNYQQADIKEVARALAGNSVDFGGTWQYRFRPEWQDHGVKTILGQTGNWNADDVRRILLDNPHCAEFLARKFYREYISVEVNKAAADKLAVALRENQYEIKPFMRALLMSNAFWDARNRGQLVKTPIELVVGFARTMGLWMPDGETLDTYTSLLGEQLFEPPTVAGWKRGFDWLDPASLALRKMMISNLWYFRNDALSQLSGNQNDLMIRLSGEATTRTPKVPYSIEVDGKEVLRGVIKSPAGLDGEGLVRFKPRWETVRIPREQLPSEIHQVVVKFEQTDNQTAIFTNWVQIDGRRVSTAMAKGNWPDNRQCGPVGMIYCTSSVTFDMSLSKWDADADTRVLKDRDFARYNDHIEYGTTRLPLAMRPAALEPREAAKPVVDTYQALQRTSKTSAAQWDQLWQAITVAKPLEQSSGRTNRSGTNHSGTNAAIDERALQALTLDLVYNLK